MADREGSFSFDTGYLAEQAKEAWRDLTHPWRTLQEGFGGTSRKVDDAAGDGRYDPAHED